mmetsp:Transcript_22699/g.44229  ORF Transcript_22699/g.44229 Transcript_22699/m.44229 type:complete len:224 (+) Transcript_22699:196-867(+)
MSKYQESQTPPSFAFKTSPESTMDAKQQLEKAVRDYQMKVTAWMCGWNKKDRALKDSKKVCNQLLDQLSKAMVDMEPDSPEFMNMVTTMADIVADQLVKRKQARMLVSKKASAKDKQAAKKLKKQHKQQQDSQDGGGEQAPVADGGADGILDEMKGLGKLGPVEAIRALLTKLGPMNTTQLSQVYMKITGNGFKKVLGESLNHVLRENGTLFVREKDKKWACK